MSVDYYYLKDGTEMGPYSLEVLREKRAEGLLTNLTLIAGPGHKGWQNYSKILPGIHFELGPEHEHSGRPLHPVEKVALLPFPHLERCNIGVLIFSSGGFCILVCLIVAMIFFLDGSAVTLPAWSGQFMETVLALSSISLLPVFLIMLATQMAILYRGWLLLSPFGSPLIPDRAAAGLFIPVIGHFWNFRCYRDWSREYHALLEREEALAEAPSVQRFVFLMVGLASVGHFLAFGFSFVNGGNNSELASVFALIGGAFLLIHFLAVNYASFQIARAVNYVVFARKEALAFQRQSRRPSLD
ncbi:MAG: DUF4339 domain-containing protein [Roseibacillus sp.]